MPESNHKKFNHLKIHTQYSICEGAIKIDELKDSAKELKISALGMCDTSNLCGAVEFSDKLSKVGTQPIIGTQINFKFNDTVGLLPLFALDIEGYKKIIELSSRSYLENDDLSDPHLDINDLLRLDTNGISVFSGTIFGLFGKLFDKAKFDEIINFYKKLNAVLGDRFYLEIQRHEDHNESEFEKFNLDQSKKLEIPIIATNEVFYLTKDMHEAHDALICIGNKTYVNDKNRIKYSPNHYLKNDSEMSDLFFDLPEALENNYNFPYRSSFRPLFSKPILPNISSSDEGNASDIIKKNSLEGLKEKFNKFFDLKEKDLENNDNFLIYKDRLDHELEIIVKMDYSSYFLIVSDYLNWEKVNKIQFDLEEDLVQVHLSLGVCQLLMLIPLNTILFLKDFLILIEFQCLTLISIFVRKKEI